VTVLLAPRLGEAIFNLVYFHQQPIPVEVPNLAMGYIWFAKKSRRDLIEKHQSDQCFTCGNLKH
jgi:hypothetical protein